jgi:hypothetical protein
VCGCDPLDARARTERSAGEVGHVRLHQIEEGEVGTAIAPTREPGPERRHRLERAVVACPPCGIHAPLAPPCGPPHRGGHPRRQGPSRDLPLDLPPWAPHVPPRLHERVEAGVPPQPRRDPRIRAGGERLVPGLVETDREPAIRELADPVRHRAELTVGEREIARETVTERLQPAEEGPVRGQGPRGGRHGSCEVRASRGEVREGRAGRAGRDHVRARGVEDDHDDVRAVAHG